MSYEAEISRSSPTAILIVIDQSTSMNHRLQSGKTKATFLADVVNKTIYTIITNCSKADGIRDYFDIGVLSYSGTDSRNALDGQLSGSVLNPISRIADFPLRVEDRTRKVVGPNDDIISQSIKFPVWLDPRCRGKTSMCAGLTAAAEVIQGWCVNHSLAFPPTVLHVTDGHPTDGNPEPIADKLKGIGTEDGRCLLFNLHVDIGEGSGLLFPNDERALRDRFAKMLFRMSSTLPPHAMQAAIAKGYSVRPGARGFVFNAGIEGIADFFDIGTRPARSVNH